MTINDVKIGQHYWINDQEYMRLSHNMCEVCDVGGIVIYPDMNRNVSLHAPEKKVSSGITRFCNIKIGGHFEKLDGEYVKTSKVFAVHLGDGVNEETTWSTEMPSHCWVTKIEHSTQTYKLEDVKPKKSFRPDRYMGGYHLNSYDQIQEADACIDDVWNQGNWRATKEGAEKLRNYRAALQRVREWKHDNCEEPPVGPTRHYEIIYAAGGFFTEYERYDSCGCPAIGVFANHQDVKRCIVVCSDDLKIIFGI